MDYLCIDVIYVDDEFLKKYFYNFGIVWIFNFFYVFYMGGVWERMIGIICRIFDFMLIGVSGKILFYDVLNIFMVEVVVIINFRLFVLVFIDLDFLLIFILVMLLI